MASLLLRTVRSSSIRPCIRLMNSRLTPAIISRSLATEKGYFLIHLFSAPSVRAAQHVFLSSTSLESQNSKPSIATPEEMATGLEKLEYDAVVSGIEDPFRLKMATGPPGTAEKPTEVPSAYGERIVGCVCEEDATMIKWMLVKKGEPQRCDCGNYFVLKDANPIDIAL